jgi:FkbM family methyltransferase
LDNFRTRHFGLRHIVVAFLSQKLFGNYTYTIRHGLATGMRRKGGLGFLPVKSGENAETEFLRKLPLAGKVVYDVGAFEGLITLFFASKAKQVISWEPNPRNYSRAIENVRLNNLTNVQILNRGISNAPGTIDLLYDPLMPGAGSGDSAIKDQIGGSVKSAQRISIPVARLDDELGQGARLPPPDLVKIDIEGMELQALQGMHGILRDRRPALYIEMHGATTKEKVENAHAVTAFLEELEYKIYDVERGDYITLATLGERRPGHIYCTV